MHVALKIISRHTGQVKSLRSRFARIAASISCTIGESHPLSQEVEVPNYMCRFGVVSRFQGMAAVDACAWCSKAMAEGQISTKEDWLNRKSLAKCSSCHSVAYCSRLCQRRHWALHKSQCPKLREKWTADAAVRKRREEEARQRRAAQDETDVSLVRKIVAEVESGLAKLDASAAMWWAQRKPGRITVQEVWLFGRKYTGFETITKHTDSGAFVRACEFRVNTGTFGYGCPCHGFNLMLMGAASGNNAWTPCPFGGPGGKAPAFRGRALPGALAQQLPSGFVGMNPKPAASGYGFSCEPCDPADGRDEDTLEDADGAGQGQTPTLAPYLRLGFSCTPCDPAEEEKLRISVLQAQEVKAASCPEACPVGVPTQHMRELRVT